MSQPFPTALCFAGALALCLLPQGLTPASADVFNAEPHSLSAAKPVSVSTLARNHWQAISQGNVPALMDGYRADAVLHWKEGAFAGDHNGSEAIQAVWVKFAKLRAPLNLTVQKVEEKHGSHGIRIVTAQVTFRNTDWAYPLAYCLTFQDGKIVEETWQMSEPDADPILADV